MDCGKEIYYYAKDINDPSITWGLVKWEYFPPSASSICHFSYPWNHYLIMWFTTKYFPDLQVFIPNSAKEGH